MEHVPASAPGTAGDGLSGGDGMEADKKKKV
jgi:hypothetical protein